MSCSNAGIESRHGCDPSSKCQAMERHRLQPEQTRLGLQPSLASGKSSLWLCQVGAADMRCRLWSLQALQWWQA